MATGSHYISFNQSRIHYTKSGQGHEWLFCFHGYGEDSSSFELLEPVLAERFTMIAIDMPFHGKTDWREGLLFMPSDLISIIDLIKPEKEKMHLLGYSMGGRVALQLLQLIPEKISKALLIAPDGLHKNKWQWLATRTLLGNTLFHSVMKNPGWTLGFLDLADRLRLYNKNLLKFVHYYLDNAEQRLILYQRWTTMRKFKPDLHLLKKTITRNRIPVSLLFGRFDKVILSSHGIHFSKNSEGWITVEEIEAGHRLLRDIHIPLITALLVG